MAGAGQMKGQKQIFGHASDEWATPLDLFERYDKHYHFALDGAATAENSKCERWLGPGGLHTDALACGHWLSPTWLNPPYSQVRAFMIKTWEQMRMGVTTVCLVPARTDTRWWHDFVWGGMAPRQGVHIEFLKGRVKFVGPHGPIGPAPFPSVVITFIGK